MDGTSDSGPSALEPGLEDEDIRQALLCAAAHLDDRVLDLPPSHETAAWPRTAEIGGGLVAKGGNRYGALGIWSKERR